MANMFETRTADGLSVQMDDTYRNYYLRRSYRLYESDFSIGQVYLTQRAKYKFLANETSGMNRPIVCARPNGRSSAVSLQRDTSGLLMEGPYQQTAISQVLVGQVGKGVDYIDVYIFDDWTPPQRDAVGLELLNASGEVIFNSGWYPLRVVSATTPYKAAWGDFPQSGWGGIYYNEPTWLIANLPAGKTYAGFISPITYLLFYPDGSYGYSMSLNCEAFYFDGTAVRSCINFYYEDDTAFDYQYPWYRDWLGQRDNKFFAIDVTGYPLNANFG